MTIFPVVSTIAFVGGITGFENSGSGTSLTLTYTPTTGNFVHITACTDSDNPGQISAVDNNGNILPLIQNVDVRANPHGMAQFGGVAAAGAASYTISWPGGGSQCGAALTEYSGATAAKAVSNSNGTSTSWSNALAITSVGNWIVTGFGSVTLGNLSTTTTTGTARETSDNSTCYNQVVAIDNTNSSGNAAAGVISSGGTVLGWGVASFELQAAVTFTASSIHATLSGTVSLVETLS